MNNKEAGEFSGEGAVDGEKITWIIPWESQGGKMTMTRKGKASGDEISGEFQFGGFGSTKWKAKRKEE